ncbi:MAG: hypothetical protein ABSH00_17385 [Bryobacteraceae bacterium]
MSKPNVENTMSEAIYVLDKVRKLLKESEDINLKKLGRDAGYASSNLESARQEFFRDRLRNPRMAGRLNFGGFVACPRNK